MPSRLAFGSRMKARARLEALLRVMVRLSCMKSKTGRRRMLVPYRRQAAALRQGRVHGPMLAPPAPLAPLLRRGGNLPADGRGLAARFGTMIMMLAAAGLLPEEHRPGENRDDHEQQRAEHGQPFPHAEESRGRVHEL